MPDQNAELYGVTIDREVARRALNMGRDAFDAALKSNEIPNVKFGARRKILGVPFRRMLGLPEHDAQSAA